MARPQRSAAARGAVARAPVAAPAPKKRGRPPSRPVETAPAKGQRCSGRLAQQKKQQAAQAPAKRGPGRPLARPLPDATPPPRKRGRPPSQPPPDDERTPEKRGRLAQRPPLVVDCTPAKRGPGRPPSNPAALALQASANSVEEKAVKLAQSLRRRGVVSGVVASSVAAAASAAGARTAKRSTSAAEAEAARATLAGLVGDQRAVLERAAAALRPDFNPGLLPCRETEQSALSKHLRAAVGKGGTLQVLYVSGMPGTGKTACVLRAVEQLRVGKGFQKFSLVHVNAMRLGAPTSVFAAIHAQLPDQGNGRCSASAAQRELDHFFSKRKKGDQPLVLLIDEIDHLVTKSQAVLYRLFNWLQNPWPGLVVVAISNTMDLPERLLPRVASRFGVVRVDFEPYKRDQIQEILQQRLRTESALDAFHPDALKLCAARVAAGSGDIRKALQLCKRAVEVRLNCAGKLANGPVVYAHLQEAERDLLHANPAVQHIAGLSSKARRFLTALLLELWQREADAVPLTQVALRYGRLLEMVGDLPATSGTQLAESCQDEASHLAERLSTSGVIVCHQARAVGVQAIQIVTMSLGGGCDAEDLADVLRGAEEHRGLQELIKQRQEEELNRS